MLSRISLFSSVTAAALASASTAAAEGEALQEAPGAPAPANTTASLTLERAVAEGARRGPLAGEAWATRAAAQELASAPGSGLPSVPQLTVQAGLRDPRGLPLGPEVIVSAQQEFAARALGDARRRAAQWTARAAEDEVQRVRLEGALTAALAWIALLEAQELQTLRSAALADAEGLERFAAVRAVAGVVPPADAFLAKAEVGSASLAVLDGEGRATLARLDLALATGAPMDRPVRADGALAATDERAVDASAVLVRVRRNPAVRAAEARAMHASADVDVVRATMGPSFFVGASAWREGTGDVAATGMLSVPLTLFDPARYDRAQRETVAVGLAARVARVRAELEHHARLALHEREHTREVRAQLREGVVAPLRRAMVAARAAYAAGTTDLAPVLLARRSLFAAEDRLVSASAEAWRADLLVAALAGTLLTETR
jgi:cobalt-zinc-cadmium efflux system outer membrane protein